MSWGNPSAVPWGTGKEPKRRPRPVVPEVDEEYERCLSGNVTRPGRRLGRENVRNSPETVLRPHKK